MPKLVGELSVQGDKANQNYQQAWAYSVSTMIGNINPQNIDFVKKIMMKVLSPQLQVQIKPMLDRQAEMIKMRDIDQVFIADDLMHEPETDLITVWGQKSLSLAESQKQIQRWSYEFKVVARNGRPKITHIEINTLGTPRKRNQAMKNRNEAPTDDPSAQPYYDSELEVGVFRGCIRLKGQKKKRSKTR
jgi:hypothetical protein